MQRECEGVIRKRDREGERTIRGKRDRSGGEGEKGKREREGEDERGIDRYIEERECMFWG